MGQFLGEYLQELRLDRKLTLYDVQKKTQLSRTYLERLERGERGAIAIKVLAKLAKLYGVHVSALSGTAEHDVNYENFSRSMVVVER